jgi:hypothetical protein
MQLARLRQQTDDLFALHRQVQQSFADVLEKIMRLAGQKDKPADAPEKIERE